MDRQEKQKAVNRTLSEKYGLDPAVHFWKQKQSGLFIATYDAIMIIAENEGITFTQPIQNWDALPNICIMISAMHPDGREVWTFGECSADNNRNVYPFAMAEKRAKSRGVLMLINAYQYGVKSEVEADDFKRVASSMEDGGNTDYHQEQEAELTGKGKPAENTPTDKPGNSRLPGKRKAYNLSATTKQRELVNTILTEEPRLWTDVEVKEWLANFEVAVICRREYGDMIDDLKAHQNQKRFERREYVVEFAQVRDHFESKGLGEAFETKTVDDFGTNDPAELVDFLLHTGEIPSVLKGLRTLYAERTEASSKAISPPTPPGDRFPVSNDPELFPNS
ncbi:MAG: hypothetical protein CMM74_08630 [Rhodospirillaceae bacterium]|jgi:hypothetical protein|nr:hypothetical protein [Rhodospirillaceae bacterium]|tara:strand:+ start:143 stop:1150 length:1008 start_codon:yes stop_codon:yes gene_type:complete